MTDGPVRVLFVSTGDAVRGILAEALLRRVGGADFEAHSAGIQPAPIHPSRCASATGPGSIGAGRRRGS